MKPATLILFCLLALTRPVLATPFQGVVQFNYDYILDGVLNAKRHYKIKLSGNDKILNGHYIEMNNDSSWKIIFHRSRDTTIMSALQVDGDFYRVMSGEVINNKITGTWFAVGGLKGDFEIIKN